jgi:hypothetical protein
MAEELVGDEWEVVRQLLPEGWQEQARKSGAWRRSPRAFKDPETLLRVLMMHLAAGFSLMETAARAKQSGLAQVSSVAVHKRLRAGEEWLRWMADRERSLLGHRSPSVAGRRLRAVDATVVTEPGSTGANWRLHYAIDLADLQCDFFELTDQHGGETWRRVPVEAGDVLLGDRVYANPRGVAHVLGAGGDVLVRLNPSTLPLYDRQGKRLPVLAAAEHLQIGEVLDEPTWIRVAGKERFAGRLVVRRRSAESERAERRRIERKASKKQENVSDQTLQLARYFLVWTTLPTTYAGSDVLEFYRWRWQIELAFKRMKSILGLGHLPKKDPATARAWLHGKLLTSLLVERIIQAANTFSPWGY